MTYQAFAALARPQNPRLLRERQLCTSELRGLRSGAEEGRTRPPNLGVEGAVLGQLGHSSDRLAVDEAESGLTLVYGADCGRAPAGCGHGGACCRIEVADCGLAGGDCGLAGGVGWWWWRFSEDAD